MMVFDGERRRIDRRSLGDIHIQITAASFLLSVKPCRKMETIEEWSYTEISVHYVCKIYQSGKKRGADIHGIERDI